MWALCKRPPQKPALPNEVRNARSATFGLAYADTDAMTRERRAKRGNTDILRCSFCRKSQSSVRKLISSPSDDPRAFICDECVAVCASIIADDQELSHEDRELSVDSVLDGDQGDRHPLVDHPLTSQLLKAVERWVIQQSLGADATEEFADVQDIARQLVRQRAPIKTRS